MIMWVRAFLIAVLVCLVVLRLLKELEKRKKYPPGASLLRIAIELVQNGFRLHPDMLAKWAKRYGNIYTIWGGFQPLVILSGFQTVKEALIKHSEDFSDRPVTPFYHVIANEQGIVFSNGHTWSQQRKFGVVTLRKLGLGKKGVQNQIEEEALQLVETFAHAKGQPLDPSLPIINSVCNVICALVFGHRYSANDEQFLKLVKAIEDSVTFGGTFFHFLYEVAPWLMKYIPWPYKMVFAAKDTVLSHARKETEQHRAQQSMHEPQDFIDYYLLQMEKANTYTGSEDGFRCHTKQNYTLQNPLILVGFKGGCNSAVYVDDRMKSGGSNPGRVLVKWTLRSHFLVCNTPGTSSLFYTSKKDPTLTFNDENLSQCISDLFVAGTDTTSSTLQWGLLLMVTHPDIQEKIQKEIEDAFGSSQSISYQDRKKVPYTFAAIHEIQRFKCILLAGNPRANDKDVNILGSSIPKGTMVVPDVHSVLYDPKLWETPRKFNPNHFLDQDGKFVDREELVIFGAGARICIGKEMAKVELFTFFTHLLRAFTFKMPEGVKEPSAEPKPGLTMSPRHYKLCAVSRYSES